MTLQAAGWLSAAGLAAAAYGAAVARALDEFSHHDLETLCRRRGRRERLAEILDHEDRVRLAADSLRTLGVLAAGWGAWTWVAQAAGQSPAQLAGRCLAAAVLILAAAVWLPHAVRTVWAEPLLYYSWPAWRRAARVLVPLTAGAWLFHALLRRMAGEAGRPEDEEEAFEDEIRTMVRAGRHEGLLEEDAQEMIEGVIELGDTDVSDIMTPRSEVDAIEARTEWPEALRFVIQSRRTRIPVYDQTLDHIVGVLYVKDLLPELVAGGGQPRRPLRDLLRPPWFVPATIPVDDMLRDFLRTRNHLAIVVDEYKAVAGVVTIEDALEEIVGEIVDEYDSEEEAPVRELPGGAVEASGRAHVDELNEQFGFGIPESEDHDTIGGFVVSRLGRIPAAGEALTHGDLRIEVLEANKRRVERVRISRIPAERTASSG